MKPLQKRLRSLGETRPVLRAIQRETIAGAKARVPRKTGFLARSILPGELDDDSVIVRVTAPYAAPVEFGSKPHVIVPRNKRMLAWPAGDRRLSGRARTRGGKPTGPMVFAKKVNHPGTKAQPFVVPAAIEAIGRNLKGAIIKLWNDAA